jgi:hypothetical protein
VPDLSTDDDGELMASISVRCEGELDEGWTCHVSLREGGREISTHRVRVRAADLSRLDPGATEPDELVEASFAFLLERESPGMILRSFDLAEIARYFPEFDIEFPVRNR